MSTKLSKNHREAAVQIELEKNGWEVYHKGFPDFICFNPNTDQIQAIEVKRKCRNSQRTGLSRYQRIVIDLFKKAGIQTTIVYKD